MHAEIAWALASSGAQVQPQIILDPDYLPEYLSVSYDYGARERTKSKQKPSHVTLKLTTRSIIRFSPQTMQCYH